MRSCCILKGVDRSQYTQRDLTVQFFRGYLHVKYWGALAGFLPQIKGLQDICAVRTTIIWNNTQDPWARPGRWDYLPALSISLAHNKCWALRAGENLALFLQQRPAGRPLGHSNPYIGLLLWSTHRFISPWGNHLPYQKGQSILTFCSTKKVNVLLP